MDLPNGILRLARPNAVKLILEMSPSVHPNRSDMYRCISGAWYAYWICSFNSVVTIVLPKYSVAFAPSNGFGRFDG
jgi:hypothetical protein